MAYRKIEQAMKKGRAWAEEQIRGDTQITPEMVVQAAAETYRHRGQQYLFMTSAMEVLLERDGSFAKSA